MTPRGLMVHTTDDSLGELQDFCFHVLKGLAPSGEGVWRKGQVMGLQEGNRLLAPVPPPNLCIRQL